MLLQAWQCRAGCAVFETIGTPEYCPHCGSRELEPQADGVEQYTTYDEQYVNYGERSEKNQIK